MSENILTIAVVVLGSNWFGTILKDWLDSKKKKKKPSEEMLLALGRRQLLEDAKHYINLGYIPEDEYEVFEGQFKAYIAMKGNSKVKKLCEEALELKMNIKGDEDECKNH